MANLILKTVPFGSDRDDINLHTTLNEGDFNDGDFGHTLAYMTT